MVFNWFRREYSDATEKGDATKKDSVKQDTPTKESAKGASAEPPAQPTSPEEYLKWAKAAYQNIQKRQTEATEEAEAPPETGNAEPQTEAIAPPPPEPTTESETEPTTESETESVVESASAALPAAPEEAEPPSLEPKPEPEPTAAVPLWAKAQAERQERMERLRAEAVTQPEPEVAEPEPEADPDLPLDEGFLWSAEVLARQGRKPEEVSVEEITWLKRLRQGLAKTRLSLINQLKAIVGAGPLNEEAVMEVEALLLQADVGVDATDTIIEALQQKLRDETLPPEQAIAYLKGILRDMLDEPIRQGKKPMLVPEKEQLNVWLITGVNGAGKTTTIGKLAHISKKSDYHCLIAAADTFRAAAVEQVKIWGDRSATEVIANPGKNADPAAVVFDAISAAKSRNIDLLLVDTAGRLQNKKNLMDELSKVRRIIDKKAPEAAIESLLVLDATLGQNGLKQAQVFAEAADLTGVILTKLDGSAKGGVAFSVVQQLGLPIRFVGAGEGIEDLRPFSSYEFVEALLSN